MDLLTLCKAYDVWSLEGPVWLGIIYVFVGWLSAMFMFVCLGWQNRIEGRKKYNILQYILRRQVVTYAQLEEQFCGKGKFEPWELRSACGLWEEGGMLQATEVLLGDEYLEGIRIPYKERHYPRPPAHVVSVDDTRAQEMGCIE